MADSIDIQVDSYRGKCNLQGASNINGLSWLTSLFKHLDSLGAVNSCTLKTNSPLLANCFRAEVNINNLKWKKITSVDCSVENPNPFPGYVKELQSLTTGICIKEMEIKVHFGNKEVSEVWNKLSSQILPELYSETLRIKFKAVSLEEADFLILPADENVSKSYFLKDFPFCFLLNNDKDDSNSANNNGNYITIRDKGSCWTLSKNNLDILGQFLEFFYLHKRFIEVVQNCMETPTFKTIDDAKKLIELLHCCVPEFHPDIPEKYLLIDNSEIKNARLGEHFEFMAFLHQNGSWGKLETIKSTKELPKASNLLTWRVLPVPVAYIIHTNLKEQINRIFVFTPEKTILGKDVSIWNITNPEELDKALRKETIDLRYKVLSDGGTDSVKLSYTVIQPEKLIGNNGYPCGTKLKLQIKIDNSRLYNVETHPLVCTLGGSPLKLGEPQKTGNEIIYTWEYCFNKPGVFEFVAKVKKASKENQDVTASQKFTVRPIPDAILCAMKPYLKMYSDKIAKVDHEPIIGQIKSIKKFVCFPDVECIFKYAAFNKAEAEAKGASADAIINHQIDCWDSTCTLTFSGTDRDIYTYSSQTHIITFKKAGEFSFLIKSEYNPNVCHEVKFKVVKNRAKVALKILYAGLIISIVSSFQYGLAGIGFLKFITPLVTSWIGTHDAEYLSSRQNKIIFLITLLASWGILLWGVWQEL